MEFETPIAYLLLIVILTAVKNIFVYLYVFVSGILTPTDEFQYWADLAVSAKGEDRERACFFSDAFQRQIAAQFASLSSLSMADVTELVEETHDVLDEIWKQTDFDKSFPEARMKRLLEVIGTHFYYTISLNLFHIATIITPPPIGERSIVIVPVGLCVFVCLSVCDHISGTMRAIFTKFLCMLPMAVARSSSGCLLLVFVHYLA